MPLRTNTPMPSLEGATEWLNGEAELSSFEGQPALVHFWSVGCHICHENMPKVKAWKDEFIPKGLKVVALHMPRSADELDVEEIKHQVKEMEITEPCGVDNDHAVAEAFDNRFVPAYFLFDREGKLRSRTAGDAGLTNMENALKRLFEPAS